MATFNVGTYVIDTTDYVSGGTTTSITLDFTGCSAGDTLLAIISKDDDVATSGGTGFTAFTQVLGLAGNAQMYLEVWKKEATGSETTFTWTGDSEEYAATALVIQNASYASITAATSLQGVDAVPTSPNISPTPNNALLIAGYGTDQDNSPATLNAKLTTELCELYSTTGAGAAALHVGAVSWPWTGGWATASASMGTSGGRWLANFGTGSSAMVAGGYTGTVYVNTSREWNGTSWAAAGTFTTARGVAGSTGVETAGLLFGGRDSSVYLDDTEEYNGSSWSSGGNLPGNRGGGFGVGTQTSAVQWGGRPANSPLSSTTTYEYNGTSWSSGGTLPIDIYNHGAAGTDTAALHLGGSSETNPGTSRTTLCHSYNGTSWSSEGSMNIARSEVTAFGTTSDAGAVSGNVALTADRVTTETYNGTSWAAGSDVPEHRYQTDGSAVEAGGTRTTMVCGGYAVGDPSGGKDTVLELSSTPVLTPTLDMAHSISSSNDWAAFSLYIASASTPRDVTCGSAVMALTANAATVEITPASRTVVCATEALSLTATASVNFTEEFRYVNCSSEALALTAAATVSIVGEATVDFSDTCASGLALLVVLTMDSSTASTPPAGWTLQAAVNNNNTMRTEIYKRTSTGTETTYTWTHPSAPLLASRIRLYNVLPATIQSTTNDNATPPSGTYSTRAWAPGITANAKGDTVVSGVSVDGNFRAELPTVDIDKQLSGVEDYTAGSGASKARHAFGFEFLKSKTVWTTDTDLLEPRLQHSGAGTDSAGLIWGGATTSEAIATTTEEDNGTAWSAGGTLPGGTRGAAAGGTQTAGISVGGRNTIGTPPGYGDRNDTWLYNGTAWSTDTAAPVYSESQSGNGSDSNFLWYASWYYLSDTLYEFSRNVQEFNGTSWSTTTNALAAGYERITTSLVGNASAATLYSGAADSGPTANTTKLMAYDGSTFSVAGDPIQYTSSANTAGTSGDSIRFNDGEGGTYNITENFDGSVSSVNSYVSFPVGSAAGYGAVTNPVAVSGSSMDGTYAAYSAPSQKGAPNGVKTGDYNHFLSLSEKWNAWVVVYQADPNRAVGCCPAIMTLTGQAVVTRTEGLLVVATPATMALTANQATVFQGVDRTVVGGTEALTLTTNQTTVTQGVDRVVVCTSEALSLSTTTHVVDKGRDVAATSEALSLSTTQTVVTTNRDVLCSSEALQVVGVIAALNKAREVAATTEVLALGTNAVVVDLNRSPVASTEALSLTTSFVTVSRVFNRTVSVATEALSLTSSATTIFRGVDRPVQVIPEALSLTAQPSTVVQGADRAVTATPAALTLTENSVAVFKDRAVVTTPEALALTATPAIIAKGQSRTVACTPAGTVLTTNQTIVRTDVPRNIICTVEALAFVVSPALVQKLTVSNTLPWYGREGVSIESHVAQVIVLPAPVDNANVLTGYGLEAGPDEPSI